MIEPLSPKVEFSAATPPLPVDPTLFKVQGKDHGDARTAQVLHMDGGSPRPFVVRLEPDAHP